MRYLMLNSVVRSSEDDNSINWADISNVNSLSVVLTASIDFGNRRKGNRTESNFEMKSLRAVCKRLDCWNTWKIVSDVPICLSEVVSILGLKSLPLETTTIDTSG
jgi:hypothetical protein